LRVGSVLRFSPSATHRALAEASGSPVCRPHASGRLYPPNLQGSILHVSLRPSAPGFGIARLRCSLIQEGECADTGSEERLGVTIALRTECHHPSGRGISRAVLWVLRSDCACLGFPSCTGPCFTGSSQAPAVATRRCRLPGIPLSHWSVFT
jgi:hypothetical protein